MELAEVVGLAILICVVALIVVVAVRRAILIRAGGFDVNWRRSPAADDRGWLLGQARFRGSRLGLYRSFSVLPVAAMTVGRDDLQLGPVRPPIGAEPDLLPPGVLIVPASTAGASLEIALAPDALTALRSWVESRPPGMQRPTRRPPGGGTGEVQDRQGVRGPRGSAG